MAPDGLAKTADRTRVPRGLRPSGVPARGGHCGPRGTDDPRRPALRAARAAGRTPVRGRMGVARRVRPPQGKPRRGSCARTQGGDRSSQARRTPRAVALIRSPEPRSQDAGCHHRVPGHAAGARGTGCWNRCGASAVLANRFPSYAGLRPWGHPHPWSRTRSSQAGVHVARNCFLFARVHSGGSETRLRNRLGNEAGPRQLPSQGPRDAKLRGPHRQARRSESLGRPAGRAISRRIGDVAPTSSPTSMNGRQ